MIFNFTIVFGFEADKTESMFAMRTGMVFTFFAIPTDNETFGATSTIGNHDDVITIRAFKWHKVKNKSSLIFTIDIGARMH